MGEDVPDDLLMDYDAGNPGGEDTQEQETQDKDSWEIQGDVLVRVHRRPRTTLFSLTECPDDPQPIELKDVDVFRKTGLQFVGDLQRLDLECIEEDWSEHC